MRMHRRREARQREALERQAERATRSVEQQLVLIATRRGESKKESARIALAAHRGKQEKWAGHGTGKDGTR